MTLPQQEPAPLAPLSVDRPPRARWVRVLLLLPFVGTIWVSSYNRIEPTLGGLPFFYWYQMAWILLCAVIVGIVYRAEG